jgi:hypothetical protein
MYNFDSSLKAGQVGEERFHAAFPQLQRLDGFKSDFINPKNKHTYELKSDSYDMNKTPNFFIEIYSDVARKKFGGPRQALSHGSHYWAYFYTQNNTIFLFNTKRLVKWLEQNEELYHIRSIENIRWTTTGILVNRSHLATLYKKIGTNWDKKRPDTSNWDKHNNEGIDT